ncbi:MAG TPA: FHA domain-containing protein [Pyrinomonadaceae bacterium]
MAVAPLPACRPLDAAFKHMITCNKCQTVNTDDAQYCDECGAPLDRQRQAAAAPPVALSEAAAVNSAAPAWRAAAAKPPAPEGTHALLTIQRGRSAGKEFPLHDDESYIGRWDADSGIFPDVDLDADDPEAKVSRRHARITLRAGQYFIEDLGSTNGTFINRGRRLLPGDRQPLRDGDEIIIGKTFLSFKVLAS